MSAARVALGMVELHLPDVDSLKGKRHVLKGLKEKVRARFECSVAEVDHQDTWQRATLAIAYVSADSRHANPWAAQLYQHARARGHRHPHAVRIVARAWLHVIWRCWQDHQPPRSGRRRPRRRARRRRPAGRRTARLPRSRGDPAIERSGRTGENVRLWTRVARPAPGRSAAENPA